MEAARMPELLALTPEELHELTHYVRSAEQLRELQRIDIRAHRRADGTVCVLRAWLAVPHKVSAKSDPKLRSIKGEHHG
jgi:hypothetical protein